MSWAATAIAGASVVSAYLGNQAANSAANANLRGANATVRENARQFDLIRGDTAPYRQSGEAALYQMNALLGLEPEFGTDYTSDIADLEQRLAGLGEQHVAQPVQAIRGGDDPLAERGVVRAQPQGGGERARIESELERLRGLQGEYDANQARFQTAQGRASNIGEFIEQTPGFQFNLQQGQRAIDRSAASRGRALSGGAVREGIRYASGLASNEYGNYWNRLAGVAGVGQTGVGQSAGAGVATAGNTGNALLSAGAARGNAYLQGAQATNNAVQGGIGNALLYNYLNPSRPNPYGNAVANRGPSGRY